jgi:hypothetical protein
MALLAEKVELQPRGCHRHGCAGFTRNT